LLQQQIWHWILLVGNYHSNYCWSYFDETISLTGKGDKGFLGGLFQQKRTGSQLFYDNMGAGQRSVLYKNINKNLYKPNYERSGILGSFLDLFTKNRSTYYVGSDNLDINDIISPTDDLPIGPIWKKNSKKCIYPIRGVKDI
jgi:hypothetical protein